MRILHHQQTHWALIAALTVLLLGLLAAGADGQAPADGEDPGGLFGFLRSETAEKYDLDPAAPDELLGVVVDEDDQGVAGATVYLRPKGKWNAKTLRQTVTDPRGQFTFRRLEVGAYNVAAISGARSSRTEHRKWQAAVFKPDVNREPVVLRLKPAGQATIRVVDAATKTPLPGAKIKLGYWDLPRNRVADDNGETLVEGLPTRSYEFSATAEGYAKRAEGVQFKPATAAEVVIELAPGAVLVGTVTDPDGNPVPSPRVHLRDPDDPGMFFDFMKGDVSGAYHFNHVPVGRSVIVDVDGQGDRFLGKEVTIPPLAAGETRGFDATLNPRPLGDTVIGVVTDRADEPVAGAEVSVAWQDGRVAYTNDEGRFEIVDVDRRRDELTIRADGYAVQSARITRTADGPAEAKIQLEPGNRIHARVVDEQGQPIVGAYVEFPRRLSFNAQIRTRTDENGEFQSDRAPEGATFRIYRRGYSDKDRIELPLNTGEIVEVVLEPEGVIKGIALNDATGEPLTNFRVRMTFSPERKPGDPSGGISTDWDSPGRKYVSEKGEFEIDDLVVGQPMMVTIEADGHRAATLRRVEAGRPNDAGRAEIRLKSLDPRTMTDVAGVLVNDQGEPVPNVEVRLLATVDGNDSYGEPIQWYWIRRQMAVNDRVLQAMRTVTDKEGRFSFPGVYADATMILVYWGAGVAPERVFGLEKRSREELKDLAIETKTAATLSVVIEAAELKHAASVELAPLFGKSRHDHYRLESYRPDAGGRWLIESIPPGEYLLKVQVREYAEGSGGAFRTPSIHEQRVVFASGEEKSLVIAEVSKPEED